ncbi:DUF1905 domain-containing protein [Nonomuraea sp. GTA35]|uniref:DUF1905 domain-containing protein n=1 Tax=Nonomuraea sp. GTA35 TaxID=1676746 RepID=UPI0035C01774
MRGLEVPEEVVEALGGGKRPRVTITINGHPWKSRIAIMRGRHLRGTRRPPPRGSARRHRRAQPRDRRPPTRLRSTARRRPATAPATRPDRPVRHPGQAPPAEPMTTDLGIRSCPMQRRHDPRGSGTPDARRT